MRGVCGNRYRPARCDPKQRRRVFPYTLESLPSEAGSARRFEERRSRQKPFRFPTESHITQPPAVSNISAAENSFSAASEAAKILDMASPKFSPVLVAVPTKVAINKRRLMRDLNAVSRIGIGSRRAVTRLLFSIKELGSRQVLIQRMRQAGLKIHI